MGREQLKVILTEDGSHTIYIPSLKETFHSKFGALLEARHIFISKGLEYVLGNFTKSAIDILEVGFGTGLNALLTSLTMEDYPQIQCQYHAIDPHPMSFEILKKLNYSTILDGAISNWNMIHESDWNVNTRISNNINLLKHNIGIEELGKLKTFNLVYFDAFAPNKQPEVWEPENIKKVFDVLETDGILVTYCAQGAFQRNLKESGFQVDVLQGPPGKMQMVRARKP